MSTKCRYCRTESEEPKGYRRNFCDFCIPDKEIGIPYLNDKIYIPGYGNESLARVNELKRDRIVGWKPDGTYYPGRLGENGKLQERQVDLTR